MVHLRFADSYPIIQSMLHKITDKKESSCTGNVRDHLQLNLPAECNDFDWDTQSTSSNESISPLFFRPGQPESPLDLDFDHRRASLGKSQFMGKGV